MKSVLLSWLSKLLDVLGLLITPGVAAIAAFQAIAGAFRLPLTYKVWDAIGLSPIRHHYYQPIFNVRSLPDTTWTKPDPLYGIDINAEGQLSLLNTFQYNDELAAIPLNKSDSPLDYFYDNYNFGPGDAEILYSVIRSFKPKRIIEIGSGFSTRIAKKALDMNQREGIEAEHICIEPFEMEWLEKLGVSKVIRSKVEDVEIGLFETLEENDILFIDSSHVLRTGGDVFVEFLRVLPLVKKGVLIHIHDIFLPYDYPKEWIQDYRRFWTEQYVLQAFLAHNDKFKVLLGLNYLSTYHNDALSKACPVYGKFGTKIPTSSFWIQRVA